MSEHCSTHAPGGDPLRHGYHHDHHHHHHHHHGHGDPGHSHAPSSFGTAFAVGTALNLAFVVVEAGYGIAAGSMALLADAGHNLSDVLSLLIAITSLGAGAAYAYTPPGGARFNDPSGGRAAENTSMVHIRKSIQSAKRGSIIRIATYSHSRADITNALIDACKNRNVTVQMVINPVAIS